MKRAIFLALLLACGSAAARDVGQIPAHPDPKISNWFRTAKSPNGTACCDEADGYREGVAVKAARGEPIVIFRSWSLASDGYHLSLVDPTDLRPFHLIWDGPVVRGNPTDSAVVWLARENGITLVRCFSPGPQSQEIPIEVSVLMRKKGPFGKLTMQHGAWIGSQRNAVVSADGYCAVETTDGKLVVRSTGDDCKTYEVAPIDCPTVEGSTRPRPGVWEYQKERQVRCFVIACLAFSIAGAAQATYKAEYESHSPALRAWFKLAKPTPEFLREHSSGEGLLLSWGCCEHADRVHVKFIPNRESDDWSFQCNEQTARYCEERNLQSGDWVLIPRNVVHKDPIRVPWGYDESDPKIQDEFQQLRAEGVLFIAFLGGHPKIMCVWPPESGQ